MIRRLALLLLLAWAPGARADEAPSNAPILVLPHALRVLTAPTSPGAAPALGLLPAHAWLLGLPPLHVERGDDEVDAIDPAFDRAAEAWMREHVRDQAALSDLAADLMTRVHLDIEVTSPERGVESARLVLRPGEESAWHRTRGVPVILDYDPEIACDNSGGERPSVLGDPIVRTLHDGVLVRVRASPIAGGRQVRLDAELQVGRFGRLQPTPTGALYLGALTLPRYRGGRARASGVVVAGEALEAAFETGAGRYALRVVPRVERPARDGPDERVLRWFGARALLTPRATIALESYEDAGRELASWPRLVRLDRAWDLTALRRAVRGEGRAGDVEIDARGGVWVAGSPETQEQVARLLDRLQGADGHVNLRVDLLADGAALGRAVLAVRDGGTGLLRIGTDRSYLLDTDVEVG